MTCWRQAQLLRRWPALKSDLPHPKNSSAFCIRYRWTRNWDTIEGPAIPLVEDGGVRVRVIALAFGPKSPVGMFSEWLYAEVLIADGASAPLDPDSSSSSSAR
jgi:hypothetical protein